MGYGYDPELAAALALQPIQSIEDLEAARALQRELVAQSDEDVVNGDEVEIQDHVVPEGADSPAVRVRSYTPRALEYPLPGVLYMHSGGFVLGSIEGEHARAATLAMQAGAVLVSVEYRLAPEHAYPAAVDDCFAALSWMVEGADLGVDPNRVAVAGSSSGACLAAALTLIARDRGGPHLCFQLLNAPVLDDRLETPSMVAFTDTPVWDRPSAELSWRHYLGDRADDVPAYAAPARADDLSRLPPAYIATSEFDPLRDEGILYGLRLLQAGVAAEIHNFPGAYHGSEVVESAEISQRRLADIERALRQGLSNWSGADDSELYPVPEPERGELRA